jgi:hypothetical protein
MLTRNWLIAGCLVVGAALSTAAQTAPPPAPVVPPPPVVPTTPAPPSPPAPAVPTPPATEPGAVPAPPAAPAAPAAEGATQPAGQEGPSFEFGLRGEQKCIVPFKHGDAKTEEGKIEVTPDKNTLTVTMTGGVGANVFLGLHSEAMQTFRLIQEFEVSCSDTSVREMILTLDSKLVGYVRSKHKASACVRLASLTVTPSGSSSPVLSVSHPIPCVGNACGVLDPPLGSQSKDPLPAVRSQPLPMGTYVIDANFILTAFAEGFLDAHSTAIFSPEPTELDPWEREHDPFAGEKKDGYGFTTVLTASTVDAPPQTSEKTWKTLKRRLAKEKKEKQLAKQADPRLAVQPPADPLPPQALSVPAYQPSEGVVR